MESQAAPELLVVSATASSEPAAYAHALRQLLGGVLGGIAASGAPHGGLRLAVASGRALTVSREPAPHETRGRHERHLWQRFVDEFFRRLGRAAGWNVRERERDHQSGAVRGKRRLEKPGARPRTE